MLKRKGSGYTTKFLTLTMKISGQGLKKDLEELTKNFSKLQRRKIWGCSVKSWIGVKEVSKGNVHLHVIILSRFLDQKAIAENWDKISGSSIVDIRAVDETTESIEKLTSYFVKREQDAILRESIADLRDKNKKLRFLISSREKIPTLLDNKAVVLHSNCECCGRKKYYSRISIDLIHQIRKEYD